MLPGAGISILKSPGEPVEKGEELCLVRGEAEERVQEALHLLAPAWRIVDQAARRGAMILEEITQE